MVTQRDFLEMETSLYDQTKNLKMEVSLKVGCLPYAVWKQSSIPWPILGENEL